VPAPDLTLQLLDGTQAAAHASELQVLRAEVCADEDDDAAPFAGRFVVQRRQPGFVLAEARHGGYLVGYAFGMPLRPSTDWWRYLTTPLPGEVTAEHPGRTFALVELVVRASWRRQGIGRALHDLILRDRPEERAALTVPPAATPAQNAFRNWGWRKLARTRGEQPGSPVSDVLVTTLPAGSRAPLVTGHDAVVWALGAPAPVYRVRGAPRPVTWTRAERIPVQRGAYANEVKGQAVRSHSETASYTGASREARLARTQDRMRVPGSFFHG
jgi:ribosomal protein S18 acetylase RimI-like enzyme